ncbi:MAG: alpha/beta hydrolase [Acidobacteria bacterium]|nr:alpha/beta hydrolase [Acidobacteriota bacterium]
MSKPYRSLILALLGASRFAFAGEPVEIPVRTDLPAGEEWYDPPNGGKQWVRKITRPTLTISQPDRPNGTAVIIAPGGAFQFLAIHHEGYEVAKWLNQLGVTAMVLKYRVTMEDRDAGRRAAVEDGLAALKLVRTRAGEWKLDPKRIGILGFSAGGYVAVGAALEYDASSRPDFAAPIYAAVPREFKVPADAPPLFIAYAHDDRLDVVENGARLLVEWKKAKIPAELHAFHRGGHGFGMNRKNAPSDTWTERFAEWLKAQGLLKSQ